MNVRVFRGGPTWSRHIDRLSPRCGVEDADPGKLPTSPTKCPIPEKRDNATDKDTRDHQAKQPTGRRWNPQLPSDDQYGPHNQRRSEKLQQKKTS